MQKTWQILNVFLQCFKYLSKYSKAAEEEILYFLTLFFHILTNSELNLEIFTEVYKFFSETKIIARQGEFRYQDLVQ